MSGVSKRRNRSKPQALNKKTGQAEREKQARRVKADQMKEVSSRLSIEERILKLDNKLGVGVGAKKERARIAQEISECEKGINKLLNNKIFKKGGLIASVDFLGGEDEKS